MAHFWEPHIIFCVYVCYYLITIVPYDNYEINYSNMPQFMIISIGQATSVVFVPLYSVTDGPWV
jgi:hypothetical protein